jgi:hypothetical protein
VTVLLGFLLLTFGCDAPEEDVGDVLMLPGDFVCETCGLELSEMRVLGSAYGPDAFDNIGVIVRAGSDGRIYAANEFGSHVKVFDDNGLVAQLGQRGAGPGEFMMISTMDIEDDGTLHVFDAALERHTIFGPTLELQSSKLLDIRPSHAVREWRSTHPQTTVLSLDTGFERDYAEGAAYREYFATGELMFTVPRTDRRLRNKDEVLVLLVSPPEGGERRPLAIAVKFLRKERLVALKFAGRELLVVTTLAGANRIYEVGPHRFTRALPDGRLQDADGRLYTMDEDALRAEDGDPPLLARLPARRAFWFGWFAQFPDTELVTTAPAR